jgi:hypothetical protein
VVIHGDAHAATGCVRTSNHAGYVTYNCYIYRSSVHVWNQCATGSEYNVADGETGVLLRGTSWFVCQRRFPVSVYYGRSHEISDVARESAQPRVAANGA